MRLADAVRLRPPTVSESDWRDMLIEQSMTKLLAEPELPASWHLAKVHEELLDGYYAEVGESRPLPDARRVEEVSRSLLGLGWRFAWLVVAAITFRSLLLLVVGAVVLVVEPKRSLT